MNNIFILMPAYNVDKFIEHTIERIPDGIWKIVTELVIVNDGSLDNTSRVVIKIKNKYKKVKILNKIKNEGYAKAQKTGFDYCLRKNADLVVLLHSDGQYAPEILNKIINPILINKADIVQGSRMLGGGAIEGGMPLYKYIANKFLTYVENLAYGMALKEYHSGYMAYSKNALNSIPYRQLSDTFHFDGEMLIVGHDMKLKIVEVPIPTSYGSEKSNLKPIRYGFDVLLILLRYKLGKYKFNTK